MASNGAAEVMSADVVLQAMITMRSGDVNKKKAAMDYLQTFQKSKDAWAITLNILNTSTEGEAQVFAATTLKGKITYDLATQVQESDLPALRNQILILLKKYATGNKPVRVQLCVCLAILAIQMRGWNDVLSSVVSALGDDKDSHACILDFLRVLPEEVTEGRKINLSEEELAQRTTELLGDNAGQVVQLLINYAQSSPEAATNTQLFECITSWLREVPVAAIAASPLLNVVVNGLSHEQSLAAAADCLGAMCRETSDVDDNIETIKLLLPRVVEQRSRLQAAAEDEDDKEAFKALTRLFADAGDSWVVLIAREPQHCRPLVDALLECAARDKGRDTIEYTFNFWYELKQLIVLDRYAQAKAQLVDVYSKLVDILMKLLEYPQSETANELDLFDGDREDEEKFREFRHHMGDTLKDCCQVMGTAACLSKVLEAIQIWVQKYGSQTTPTSVPHWQELEAPLFSMRAMGRMVDKEESVILPQLMPLLVQIPSHEKLRFAAIMVIGRYTEWTAVHSEFLEAQFNYIVSSFDAESKEIVRAAAQAIKFFCTDCRHLLGPQVLQLQAFYDQILDKLPELSQEEITEGVANVVGVQKSEDIYHLLKLYCDPLVERLKVKANNATTEEGKLAVADHLQLLKIFAQYVVPYIHDGQENPAVKYWQEVFPVMSAILDNFIDFVPICERVCRCWRTMLISYRTAMTPLLGPMASKLADGFAKSRQGCFLWVTGAVLREFSEEREHVDDSITDNIYVFFEAQATTVLRIMNELPPHELPDVIEDFFRLLIDALLYYPHKLIPSDLFSPIFEAAVSALVLEQRDPLSATLHYIRDLINYGGENWAGASNTSLGPAGDHIRQMVRQLLVTQGEVLVKRIMAGMMITFPRDCFADGSGVLLGMFEILPQQTIVWVERTLRMLPEGTVTPVETNRLMSKIREKLDPSDAGGLRQVRALLQDFTNTYRRRYVAPREGLGGLEPTKFHYNG